jgi:hypothetical protein
VLVRSPAGVDGETLSSDRADKSVLCPLSTGLVVFPWSRSDHESISPASTRLHVTFWIGIVRGTSRSIALFVVHKMSKAPDSKAAGHEQPAASPDSCACRVLGQQRTGFRDWVVKECGQLHLSPSGDFS